VGKVIKYNFVLFVVVGEAGEKGSFASN
jgi:hypothetical protein